MLDAVRSGTDGLVRDVAVHLAPLDVDLADVACPVHLVYGGLDRSCPPAFGVWLAAHLPHADLTVVPGAGHALMLSRWADILGRSLTS
jgi:pimeloyl-ACP methyl ester carboxylesterase